MEYETIQCQRQGAVAVVRLNRPEKLNAMSHAMSRELAEVTRALAEDESAGAVYITGNGRAFCAGGDLGALGGGSGGAIAARNQVARGVGVSMPMLWNLEKPVIAGVNGLAVGAGGSIAFAADFIVMAEEGEFRGGFVQVGTVPDMGALYRLPRLIGIARAKEFFILDKAIKAPEALALGLAVAVVPRSELDAACLEMAERLAAGPRFAIAMTKSLLNQAYELDQTNFLKLEALAMGMGLASQDFKEGVRAFREKRKPEFTGE